MNEADAWIREEMRLEAQRRYEEKLRIIDEYEEYDEVMENWYVSYPVSSPWRL